MGLVNLTELNLSNTRITGDTYSFYPLKMLKKLNIFSLHEKAKFWEPTKKYLNRGAGRGEHRHNNAGVPMLD